MKALWWLPLVALLLAAAGDDRTVCANATGERDGYFHTFWKDAGDGCLTLGRDGGYAVRWTLGPQGNLVAGRGWRRGAPDRIVGYHVDRFDPGENGYLSLYGWSRDPLVEYYVVDSWGAFTPPGPGATALGMVHSDGGTYRLFRTRRVGQPSIAGVATFDQYWSVRTRPRQAGRDATITLARHVAAWRRAGLRLGTLDYQVLAVEGYGSTGAATVSLWDARAPRKR